MSETAESLVGSLMVLGIVAAAFYLILRPIPGMDRVFQGLAGGVGRALAGVTTWIARLTFGTILCVIATVVDFIITIMLAAYHASTLRPHQVPDDWAAFATRLNDRLHRSFLAGL